MNAPTLTKPAAKKGWAPPTSLDQPKLPVFPVDCLPEPLRRWVLETAEATQTPVDLAALLSLAICAGAAARRVQIRADRGWFEPINLYTLCLLEPGNRKSAVFSAANRPLEDLERELVASETAKIAAAKTNLAIKQDRHKRMIKKAAGDGAEATEAALEASRLGHDLETEQVPVLPKLIVDDATPEAIEIALSQQGGRLVVAGAEGGLFDTIAGRYSGGSPNLDVLLKSHSGDTLRVDRVTRGNLYVDKPTLTIAYAVQPEVVRGMVGNKAFRGRGLIGRFLYAYPASPLGSRRIATNPVSQETTAAYDQLVRRLADIDCDNEDKHRLLRVSSEATEIFRDWQREIEPHLGTDGRFELMRDWAGKLAGLTVRLAAILHLVANDRPDPWSNAVQESSMLAAIKIASWACEHAEAVLAMMADGDERLEDAAFIFRWLRKQAADSAQSSLQVTRRQIHTHGRRRFDANPDRLDKALAVLVDNGWLRSAEQEGGIAKKGRPTELYLVNPVIATDSTRPAKRAAQTQAEPEPMSTTTAARVTGVV
jgi:hypothetical protein